MIYGIVKLDDFISIFLFTDNLDFQLYSSYVRFKIFILILL